MAGRLVLPAHSSALLIVAFGSTRELLRSSRSGVDRPGLRGCRTSGRISLPAAAHDLACVLAPKLSCG